MAASIAFDCLGIPTVLLRKSTCAQFAEWESFVCLFVWICGRELGMTPYDTLRAGSCMGGRPSHPICDLKRKETLKKKDVYCMGVRFNAVILKSSWNQDANKRHLLWSKHI